MKHRLVFSQAITASIVTTRTAKCNTVVMDSSNHGQAMMHTTLLRMCHATTTYYAACVENRWCLLIFAWPSKCAWWYSSKSGVCFLETQCRLPCRLSNTSALDCPRDSAWMTIIEQIKYAWQLLASCLSARLWWTSACVSWIRSDNNRQNASEITSRIVGSLIHLLELWLTLSDSWM